MVAPPLDCEGLLVVSTLKRVSGLHPEQGAGQGRKRIEVGTHTVIYHVKFSL